MTRLAFLLLVLVLRQSEASAKDFPPVPRMKMYLTQMNGVDEGTVTRKAANGFELRRADGMSKFYPLTEILRQGKVREGPTAPAHPFDMAMIGDKLMIEYIKFGDVCVCTDLVITRRPNGRVPPALREPESTPIRSHEYANAYQDLEEKGIPLPFKFLSPLEKARARIAPPPRAVKSK